jgi:hypothetical protein
MGRLVLMLTGLVRGLAGLLSEHRRDWVRALLAETDDLPSPSARLAWLGGGLWLVVREVVMNRIVQALAFAAGAVGLVWIAWPGASTNSATPVNRMYVVGTLVLLAGLPLLVRRYAGPVRPGWAPRVVRAGGYAVVLALIAAMAVQERIGSQLGVYFPVILPVWVMPPNLRHEYAFEQSVNWAGDGAIALLIVPLIGALRGHLLNPPPTRRPEGLAEGA